MRILVIDDEIYASGALASLLSARGHYVVVAHDGSAGLAVGLAGHFDAAVVDIGLEDTTGYEVARVLGAHHGIGIRLVAYTGFHGLQVKQRAHANGFDDILLKPASLDQILAALQSNREIGARPVPGAGAAI